MAMADADDQPIGPSIPKNNIIHLNASSSHPKCCHDKTDATYEPTIDCSGMLDFIDQQFNSRCVLCGRHHHPKIEGDIHTSTSTLCDNDAITNTHE
jgi:hypothetical protein